VAPWTQIWGENSKLSMESSQGEERRKEKKREKEEKEREGLPYSTQESCQLIWLMCEPRRLAWRDWSHRLLAWRIEHTPAPCRTSANGATTSLVTATGLARLKRAKSEKKSFTRVHFSKYD
jgi:hypothetical protein